MLQDFCESLVEIFSKIFLAFAVSLMNFLMNLVSGKVFLAQFTLLFGLIRLHNHRLTRRVHLQTSLALGSPIESILADYLSSSTSSPSFINFSFVDVEAFCVFGFIVVC